MIEDWHAMLARLDLSPLRGSTVLITGASGLIGRYLAGPLGLANRDRELGCRVICVSRGGLSADLDGLPGLVQHSLDLTRPFALPEPADFIIHAACPAQPSLWFGRRMALFDLNVGATRALLEEAAARGATFLFCSSAEVYGDPPSGTGPIDEGYRGAPHPTDLRAIYGETKRMAEVLGIVYREDHGVRAISARISHLYGPGIALDDTRVLGDFMRQALAGHPIRLRDAGRSVKTLGYVADAAAMLFDVLLSGSQAIYNVGGASRISIADLAAKVAALAGGVPVELPESAAREPHIGSDPAVTALDLGRFVREFGPPRFTDLDRGLARMIEWNRDRTRSSPPSEPPR